MVGPLLLPQGLDLSEAWPILFGVTFVGVPLGGLQYTLLTVLRRMHIAIVKRGLAVSNRSPRHHNQSPDPSRPHPRLAQWLR